MRKLKKFISLALSALFMLGVASCKKEETQTPETDPVATMSKVENDYRVELCNFEQWQPDFSLIRVLRNFGKVTRNKDENYVKSGKYSAKLQPVGGYYSYLKPAMYYPFSSTVHDFNYEDFSYVDCITFWMYNDSEVVQALDVGLVSKIVDQLSVERYPAETFYLKPKSWNLITYYVDFSAMGITQKIDDEDIMQIKGVYFEFNSSGSTDLANSPVFYMDDLNIYYKTEANMVMDVSEVMEFNHKEGTDVYELCDFEHVYQKYIFTPTINDAQSAPIFTVVNAEKEGIEGFSAASGKHVLRVETQGTETGKSTTQYKISGAIVRAFYDQFFFDYDTGKDIIPVEEWGNYYFAYDVYAVDAYEDFPDGYKFGTATFRDGDEGALYWQKTAAVVKQGEWVTTRVSLADIANEANHRSLSSAKVEKAYAAYKEHYEKTGGRGRRISDAGSINFTWNNFKATETVKSRVVYLDNLRVYKATV